MQHSSIERPPRSREILIIVIATAIAFLLGYWYAIKHEHDDVNWARAGAQQLMTPAVNYACTGRFGAIRLSPDAPPADTVAVGRIREFLEGTQPNYECALFPQHVLATSFFDGIDSANVEQPIYLTLLYGVLWRWFGTQWQLTKDVVAATVALSFLSIYFCARPFVRPLAAAAAALFFVFNPFYIAFTLTPRDAIKFPFAVAIAALTIAVAAVHRPKRFIFLACLLGLLIGIGFGFRSDLSLFLIPAAIVVPFLGRIDLSSLKQSRRQKLFSSVALRSLALATLILSFGVGGWMPLLNDHLFHKHSGDVGYHVMAMGLQGHSRNDLFQRDTLMTGMYMYRNGYNNDLGVGVRILEYAARRYGENVQFAQGSYWTHAKQYYFHIVSLIPADLMSGAIGAFVNLMTLPNSLLYRQNLSYPMTADARPAPWTGIYAFTRGNFFYDFVAKPLDRIYDAAAKEPPARLLVINLVVFVSFLSFLAWTFGLRPAVAALILLGVVLTVVSLKFEMRHTFYILVFPFIAWLTVVYAIIRGVASLPRLLQHPVYGVRRSHADALTQARSAARAVASVGLVLVAVVGAVLLVLLLARHYQVNTLRPLIADWAQRQTVGAETDLSEVRPGTTRIRVLSAIPLSTGGERPVDAPFNPRVEMGVIAVDVDGTKCANLPTLVAAIGTSNYTNDTTFQLAEMFVVTPREGIDYVAFMPAFYYKHDWVTMEFAGIEIDNQRIACVKGVRLLKQFKQDDVLFDFLFPKDPVNVRRQDLFQQVLIPGLGYL